MKKIDGRYEIKETLGQGGMGVVYRAYDPPPRDRDVAIKMLPEFADRLAFELFYKECKVVASLSHPNIVEIFDIGEFQEGGQKRPFFVMPVLSGQTLDKLIKESSHRLTVERVVEIISQVCRGLHAAHEHGLVHRDLKPSNIFVMADDSVKIIDFGLARALDAQTRSAGFKKGTLLYMAPEQLDNKPVSKQTDIFSLGVVCYEALTKGHPFRGNTEEEVVAAILNRIPPPASSINPAVSQAVSQAVHKAMAKQPQSWARYETAKEFGETLQKALRNQPIEFFDPTRIQPRLERATQAMAAGNHQFANEIVRDLELNGHIDPQITTLRTQIDRVTRQTTIAQLLESARARYEEDEDPLALQKLHEILQLDPTNAQALGLKATIEERRSERQIEKWIRLVEEHIANRSYGHARQALENVFALRPKEPQAARLLKELESEEREYDRLRGEKAQLYQIARDAWTNGDVSEALSHMRRVLDLDHRAPDISSPDRAGTFQTFYDTVRSEHDALDARYAEARRCLVEEDFKKDFKKALAICQEVLAKYPNQMLFQALKVDVEEQQRQQVSAEIVNVTRRLDAEFDLNAKVSLLREAVARHPGEPHFETSLKQMEGKRDVVNAIVSRARLHEDRDQISEAIGDLETLQTIYSPYPGLTFEIDRLRKRRAQQSRDVVKSDLLRQVDRHLETANYTRALEALERSHVEFPDDADFAELEERTRQHLARAGEAEDLLRAGQALCADGKFEEGLEVLQRARQLDDHNPGVRNALRDVLIERTRVVLETDWRAAEALADSALELDPLNAAARSLRAQIQDRKRDEAVAQALSVARRLQTQGDLENAASELKRVLAIYPGDQRLTVVLETLLRELTQTNQKKARLSDLEQLRVLQQQAETAPVGTELESVFARSQAVVSRYADESGESDITSVALEIERIVRARGGGTVAPDTGPAPPVKKEKAARPVVPPRKVRIPLFGEVPVLWAGAGASAAVLVLVGGIFLGLHFVLRPPPQPPPPPRTVKVKVHVNTVPEGAEVYVDKDGKRIPVSGRDVDLEAGDYDVVASRTGYEDEHQRISVGSGSPNSVTLTLLPLTTLSIDAKDIEAGAVLLDGGQLLKQEDGTFAQPVANGEHSLTVQTSTNLSEDVKVTFVTKRGEMPTVTEFKAATRKIVVVTTGAGNAFVRSNLGGVAIVVDGKRQGNLGPEGSQVGDLDPGAHNLALGASKDRPNLSITMGRAPTLSVTVYPGDDTGSIVVSTGDVDDVDVFVDGRFSGKTIKFEAPLSVTAGDHAVRVHKEGFLADPESQPVTVKKRERVRLSFRLTRPTLPFRSDTSPIHGDPGGVLQQPPSPPPPSPPPPVHVGMQDFDQPGKWELTKDGWYGRRGGGVGLYGITPILGQFMFTVKLPAKGIFGGSGHIRWVVAYVDAKNYYLIDMDENYLTITEFSAGNKSEVKKKLHHISWDPKDATYLHIAIEVSATNLIHKFKLEGSDWRDLDDSPPRKRSFATGKFGFDDTQISNFKFQPSTRR